jgi:hypothetical protein
MLSEDWSMLLLSYNLPRHKLALAFTVKIQKLHHDVSQCVTAMYAAGL